MMNTYEALKSAREEAEKIRDDALEEKKLTDENLEVTIAASWKQGSDTTGRNYYYNFVTGESRWDPPENWKTKVVDQWIRNVDERQNVYYYNQQTGESRWLPPCCVCGLEGQRWCLECGTAYCEIDYDKSHGPKSNEEMQNHTWSLTEYEKDHLKPGEVYCIECNRRVGTRTCLSCWDTYCDDCFTYVHHVGALKDHKSIAYRRAKKGWMCVKGRVQGEPDYYVHGRTGETTYEKPIELMTDQEKLYYENFLSHKKVAEEQVQKIEQLQYEVEAAQYERDTIMFDAMTNARNKKGGVSAIETVAAAQPKGILASLTGITSEYRQKLLNPSHRQRGKKQSDYIENLLHG
jgi:hypothetical protein